MSRRVAAVNLRALILALTVIAFVAISGYTYLDTTVSASPVSSNPNQDGAISATSQVGTQTAQGAPTVWLFRNQHFEPPSGILIPANTLTWANFRLNASTNVFVSGSILIFPFPGSVGANITVAIYLNGALVANSTTTLPKYDYGIAPSAVPTSTSPNSVFALSGLITTMGVDTQSSSALKINGATITVGIVSNRPIWLAGWAEADMSGGTGPQFGQSVGQLAGTYEAPLLTPALPNSLPHATTTLAFEFQVSGALSA